MKEILLALCLQRITSPSLCPDFPSRPPAATTWPTTWTCQASEKTTTASAFTATVRTPRASSRTARYRSSTWSSFSWATPWSVQPRDRSSGDVVWSPFPRRKTPCPSGVDMGAETSTRLAGGDSGSAPRPRHPVSSSASDSATRTRSSGERSSTCTASSRTSTRTASPWWDSSSSRSSIIARSRLLLAGCESSRRWSSWPRRPSRRSSRGLPRERKGLSSRTPKVPPALPRSRISWRNFGWGNAKSKYWGF